MPVVGSFGITGYHHESKAKGPGVTVGRSGASYGVISFSLVDYWPLNTALYVVDFHGNDERFAYYFLQSVDFKRYNSGSAQPSLNRNYIHPIPVKIPPLPEQRAIAHILGTLDDKIELNRQMNQTLEAMARALFQSWFVDFDPVHAKARGEQPPGLDPAIADLFPDRFVETEIGLVPEGWRASMVGDEFDLIMGQSPPGDTYNDEGVGLPFYQGRSDFGFRYPEARVYCSEPKRLAKPGDTLVSVRAPVGDVNMAIEECCVGRGVAAIRHLSGSRSYTYYSMLSLRGRFANFEGEGTVFGSINKRDFHALEFIAPHSQIIDAFEDFIGPMDELIEINSVESRTLIELRDTLLPKLMSGELRVPDVEEIVEDI